MMKPDTGGEAMSKHPLDLPGWLGTARRDRSVEEPGRPGRAGKGQPDPNGLREYITEGFCRAIRLLTSPASDFRGAHRYAGAIHPQVHGRRNFAHSFHAD